MKHEATEKSFDSLVVHAGEPARHGYDAVTMPIVCTSTYTFGSTQEIQDHFADVQPRHEYGRYSNPTVDTAERKLAALDGASDAVLFPSAMSALTTFLFAFLKPGDHVVLTSDCYRQTRRFITTTLLKFGITHTLVAPSDYDALRAALRPETRLIVSELPTNPYLRVLDVARTAELKRSFPRVKLLVDSTLAPPVNCQPLALGADLVLHSCTKYLGGHNDLLAGSLAGSAPLVEALREARGLYGGMPDPHGAYLLLRGIKTLAVRMRQHNESGLRVAHFLAQHPRVEHVFYPGLETGPDYQVARRQLRGFGGVLSLTVRGDLEAASRFVDRNTVARIATSMGGVESLIQQPVVMSHSGSTPEQRAAFGVQDNLVRLSVGLEDADELIADLDRALAC